MNQLTVTRGQAKDVVLILHRNGTIDQLLNHFMLTSSDWGDDSGSVTIAANASCSDGDGYYCETDSEVGEAFLLITVNGEYYKFYGFGDCQSHIQCKEKQNYSYFYLNKKLLEERRNISKHLIIKKLTLPQAILLY